MARPGSFRLFWLFPVFFGVVVALVLAWQAQLQSTIEHGVRGSFDVEDCGQRLGPQTGPTTWGCSGTFRPETGGDPTSARLMTVQSEPPRGQIMVMAPGPASRIVWLPSDVSSAKRWRWAATSLGLISLPSLVLFFMSGRRRKKVTDSA